MRSVRVLLPVFAILISSIQVSAQAVISARSGVVHFSEGAVFIDDQPVEQKVATFPSVKEGSTLRTEKGRAEVLLTPGVFLRLDEDSAIRMHSSALTDTRVEFLKGCVLLDTLDALADNHVTLIYKDSQVRFPKAGVYRIDFDTATLQSYSGEAEVAHDGKKSIVDDSHLFFLTLDLATKKLDGSDDEFFDWARDRSNTISAENQLASEGSGDPADLDADADPNGIGGVPNLGLPDPGAPSVSSGLPGYSIPSYNAPLQSVLVNPFSPYGYGYAVPYNPFPVYPVFVLVRPYGYRSVYGTGHPRWPHTGATSVTGSSFHSWNGVSYPATVPHLSFPAAHPVPSTVARPMYVRPAVAPHPVAAPAAVHAIGHR